MYVQNVGAVGQVDLTPGGFDQAFVNGVIVTVQGFTGSMVPQFKADVMGNGDQIAPNYFNAAYTNKATNVGYDAGTAITGDGIYVFDATGCLVSMNVTDIGDGDFQMIVQPVEGAVPGGGASSGGGGGAVTIADGADVALGTTTDAAETDPTQDATVVALLKGLLESLTIPSTATYGQVALNSATATQIVAANATRRALIISNPDNTNAMYLGGAGVTASTGYFLAPLDKVPLGLDAGAVYGISSGGTPSATYVEI